MKRTFAVVALLGALGVLMKLTLKEVPARPVAPPARASSAAGHAPAVNSEADVLARYSLPAERALVERTLARYHHNAVAVERTDGIRGLALLDRLDLEAIFLYERFPNEFRRLRDTLTDDAAAELLLHWREYFGLKRADDTDRAILISEVARLTPAQRKVAARYPNALPLLLAEPAGVTAMVERWAGDPKELEAALVALDFVSLDRGAANLRGALRTIDDHGPLALEAFRLYGIEGFALVGMYGHVLSALGTAMPLDQSLILLKVNSEYVEELLQTHQVETVASHLRHVGAAGLVEKVGGSPNALRLVVEYGEWGERALTQAGPDAAEVVYGNFADPTLRRQSVEALAEHGTMALAMLDKYATDSDFRDILRDLGAPVIPPIAASDAGPETLAYLRAKAKRSLTESLALPVLSLSGDNGQAAIRAIKNDGLDRVAEQNATDVKFTQFLPLYDLLHLGHVLGRGYSPTSGEMTWALVDGCFVVADALSLVAIQPEGVVASEVARAELKAATRTAAKELGRNAVEVGTENTGRTLLRRSAEASAVSTERLSRWWAVRMAGGTYECLRRLPQALPKLSLAELTELARPLCNRAGLRLSTWKPLRLLKDGQEILLRIPPKRGLKYLGVQAMQASVGVVAFHKMEEHLASRRPAPR